MTDANMPRSVVHSLQALDRDARESREVMPTDAKDQAVAQLAATYGFVLLSYDRDFINIRRRMLQEGTCGESQLILLRVPEMWASDRLVQVLDDLEEFLTEAMARGRIVDRLEVKSDRVTVVYFM